MKKLLFLILSIAAFSVSAATQHEATWEVIQCYEDTSIASSVGLTGLGSFTTGEVQSALRVMFQTEGDGIRWTDDGTTPTSTLGFKQSAGDPPFFYSGEPQSLKFIEESTSTDIFVCLYK